MRDCKCLVFFFSVLSFFYLNAKKACVHRPGALAWCLHSSFYRHFIVILGLVFSLVFWGFPCWTFVGLEFRKIVVNAA